MQTRQHVLKQRNMSINMAKAMLRSVGVELKKSLWPKEKHWETGLGNPAVPLWMKPLLATHRSIWEHLETQRQDIDAMINQELSDWPEAGLLYEMPGFGPIVTMGILSGIGDAKRFKRANQLASYAGLIPSSRESGSVQRRGGITKQGRSLMRHKVYSAKRSLKA